MDQLKSNSLEQINTQFKSIMDDMGFDDARQERLSAKINLSKKIKTITAMQDLDERKLKVVEYITNLSNRNSLLNLLGLNCVLESGPSVLYEIFKKEGGHNILIECMKKMEGEFIEALCETVMVIINKYGDEFPLYINYFLDSFIDGRMKDSKTLFKMLVILTKNSNIDILFKSIEGEPCIFNTYFSGIILRIKKMQKINEELTFISLLIKSKKAEMVKYVLFVLNFDSIAEQVENKTLYEEILNEIKPQATRGCSSGRINEIIRLAEQKGNVDLACCILETFLFGNSEAMKELEEEIKNSAKFDELKKEVSALETRLESVEIEKKTIQPPIKKPAGGRKIPKKIVKKAESKPAVPLKNYVQVQWAKMPKGDTIWKDIDLSATVNMFEPSEFDGFEKVIDKKKQVDEVQMQKKTIFSEKKNYAISIALGRVKVTNSQLKEDILSLKDKFDANLAKQLLFYFPSDDEIEALKTTEEVFGRAEEFFKECIDNIEQIRNSLYCLYFVATFNSQNMKPVMETFTKYYTALLTSQSLKTLLSMTLYIGNFLNQGSFLGKAEGFTLESLPAILEVKTKKTNFLDLLKQKMSFSNLHNELSIAYKTTSVNFESMCGEMEELKKNCINATGSDCVQIQEKLKAILPNYEILCEQYNEVVKLNKECRTYFGEPINDEFNNRIIILLDKLSEKGNNHK